MGCRSQTGRAYKISIVYVVDGEAGIDGHGFSYSSYDCNRRIFMQYRQDMVGGGSLGGAAAMFALNFIIGGFVLVWRLLVAMWYVSLTIYRLIVGY